MGRPGALMVLLLLATTATAADWGQITPGETTQAAVRARYGEPAKQSTQKVEGYDSDQWVYEGARAPAGFAKMIVDFGILKPSGYQKDIVRTFRLEPKPDIFNRKLVLDGWGLPGRIGKEGALEFFLYREGLLVYFDANGERVIAMIFTPPQPLPAEQGAPPAPRPQR
jgi:hypothetical protein